LSWEDVRDRDQTDDNAKKIRSGFLSLGASLDPGLENEAIGILSRFHPPAVLEAVTVASPENDYRLRYRIEAI
jgi:hypothetical protein